MYTNWELIHRFNSVLLGLFILTHLGVHLLAVVSPEAHTAGLSVMRQFYADPLYRAILYVSIAIQIYSGYAELKIVGKKGWRLVRNLSGAYLMVFMVVHVATIARARHVDNLSTDFYWAAGAFTAEPLKYAAILFYGLGVFSFFAHMLAVWVLAWKAMPRPVMIAGWGSGVVATALILLAFSGALYEIDGALVDTATRLTGPE